MAIEEPARAKVNLALHVTGQRADGYHLLDSLVVFAAVGDRVAVAPAETLRLTITGPFGAGLAAEPDNLVLRAARWLAPEPGQGAQITLDKQLPVASGIGGGSADAAATLRGLCRLWGRPLPEPAATAALGADVPVCLGSAPARMGGIGERLSSVPSLPAAWLVLANPGVAVATPMIFRGLARRDGAPMSATLPAWPDAAALAGWLAGQRNDLEPPARALQPVVEAVLSALAAQPGCLLARMSGSGATCFGLFGSAAAAATAQAALARAQPGWWVASGEMLGQETRATT